MNFNGVGHYYSKLHLIMSTDLDRVNEAVQQVQLLSPQDPLACAWVESAIWLTDVHQRLYRMIDYCRELLDCPENQVRISGLHEILKTVQQDTETTARFVVRLARQVRTIRHLDKNLGA